jgi:large subunit ribosomal protein L30
LAQKRKRARGRRPTTRRAEKEKPPEIPKGKCVIAVRLRGQAGIPDNVNSALDMLHMPRRYTAVLMYERPDTLGMLRKVKDYVTWGEIEKDALTSLFQKRCRPKGAKELTASLLKEKLQIPSIEKLADAVGRAEIPFGRLHEAGISPVFRLHPPRGGFKKTVKRPFTDEGELGYRGPEIVSLILRMM